MTEIGHEFPPESIQPRQNGQAPIRQIPSADRAQDTHRQADIIAGQEDNVHPAAAPRATASQLQHIIDNLPVLIAYVDNQRCYRFVNQPYANRTGHPPSAIVGKHMRDVIGYNAYSKIRAHVEKALAGKLVSFEEWTAAKFGEPEYNIVTFVPDREADPIRGFFVLVIDITKRKLHENKIVALNSELTSVKLDLERRRKARLAELTAVNAQLQAEIALHRQTAESLHQAEARYRAIVDSQPALIFRYRADNYELTFVNKASCRYFEKSAEALIGCSLFSLIPETDQENVRQHIAALVADKQPVTHEHQIINPDGTVAWREWTDQPILDQHGEVVEIQATGYDIELRTRSADIIRSARGSKHQDCSFT